MTIRFNSISTLIIILALTAIFLAFISCRLKSTDRNLISDYTDNIVYVTTELPCDIETAFIHFTESDLLELWLTKKADIELRVGGKYELFWTPEDPDKTNNSTYGCKILGMEKPYFINFEWRGNADQKVFMNNIRPLTNVSVFFLPITKQSTTVRLIHTGWRQGPDWDEARKYFEKAWTGAFKELRKHIIANKIKHNNEKS